MNRHYFEVYLEKQAAIERCSGKQMFLKFLKVLPRDNQDLLRNSTSFLRLAFVRRLSYLFASLHVLEREKYPFVSLMS